MNRAIAKSYFQIIFAIAMFAVTPAISAEPPSKESLIKAWEEEQQNAATTVTFEKTDVEGLYTFETTLFPYKGTLKLLNVVMDKDLVFYDDYDLQQEGFIIGAVEVELVDAPEGFVDQYPHSTAFWKSKNHLYYVDEAEKWMSAAEWEAYNQTHESNVAQCATPSKKNKFEKILTALAPILFFIIFMVFLIVFSRRQQKAHMAKYEALTNESLSLSRQHIELMKALISKIDNKKS